MSWAGTDPPTPPTRSGADHTRLSVPTDLFVATEGLDASALSGAIPPACRRGVDTARLAIEGKAAVLESPEWVPGPGVRHLVPSFSMLRAPACSFRFEVSARTSGSWTPWVATATIGPGVFPTELPSVAPLAAEIDLYTAPRPLERVRLRVRVSPARALAGSWMMALSASDGTAARAAGQSASRLQVPALSQMDEAPELRDRVCSPTCVAMVLAFWGHRVSATGLSEEVFHPGLDLYGVWPAAIHAAARRGLAGYLLRFPDWAAAAWCLDRGLPVIASIRFEPGELQGAPLPRSAGHLVVLTGEDGAEVLVNDPAATPGQGVPRRYGRAQFCRVWLERSGVGYVLFPPGRGHARPSFPP
jgi:hypothetical protein